MQKKAVLPVLALLLAGACAAQTAILPGGNMFDKSFIKQARYEMACFTVNGGQKTEISTFAVEINPGPKTLAVYTSLTLSGANGQWLDTSIADAATLSPVYRSSYNPNRQFSIKYGREATGYYTDKQKKKTVRIQEKLSVPCFDSYLYPYLLGALPLASGYKATMAVFDYKPENNGNIKTTRIEEVKNSMYKSEMSGEHKAWQVSVFEEATNEKYEYYIDKETRRLWKVEIIQAGGQRF